MSTVLLAGTFGRTDSTFGVGSGANPYGAVLKAPQLALPAVRSRLSPPPPREGHFCTLEIPRFPLPHVSFSRNLHKNGVLGEEERTASSKLWRGVCRRPLSPSWLPPLPRRDGGARSLKNAARGGRRKRWRCLPLWAPPASPSHPRAPAPAATSPPRFPFTRSEGSVCQCCGPPGLRSSGPGDHPSGWIGC